MADALPIDASNRGISGRREEVVMGCSMEALTRKGRNEEASQALDNTEKRQQDEQMLPFPGSQTASSNTQ